MKPMNQTMKYTPENIERWKLPSHYMGAHWEGYFVAPVSRNRDSDTLTESNWSVQWERLKGSVADIPEETGEDGRSPVVVTENHFLCGWVEWVAIHETNEAALREADAMAARLESYPVLSEEHWSELETKEADRVWRDHYREQERVEYIRKNRGQFEFHSFSDLLGCVRGKYFSGYASELLA